MQVLLIRPAAAVHGVLDSHGRGQARALGERLRWYDCAPTRVWATPTAIGTAEVIAAVLTAPPHVEAIAIAALAEALDRIRAAALDGMIAICADEPLLSALGARLLAIPFAPLPCAHAARIVDGRLRWRLGWDADAAEPC